MPNLSSDPVAGRALAQHACAECHLVAGPNAESLQRGPSFIEIANDPKVTEDQLRTFLQEPHGEMPDIPLERYEINDLVSYILGLRE